MKWWGRIETWSHLPLIVQPTFLRLVRVFKCEELLKWVDWFQGVVLFQLCFWIRITNKQAGASLLTVKRGSPEMGLVSLSLSLFLFLIENIRYATYIHLYMRLNSVGNRLRFRLGLGLEVCLDWILSWSGDHLISSLFMFAPDRLAPCTQTCLLLSLARPRFNPPLHDTHKHTALSRFSSHKSESWSCQQTNWLIA